MAVPLPEERCYYPASRGEPGELLCWIPRTELEDMIQAGKAEPRVLDHYPGGLEAQVTAEGMAEAGVDLAIDPGVLRQTYARLEREGMVPESKRVRGVDLERIAREEGGPATARLGTTARLTTGPPQALPEPSMSGGDDPTAVLRRLSRQGGS